MPLRETLVAVLALVRKDLRLYFSNRRALFMSILAPIATAAFFGSLFSGGAGSDQPAPIAIAVSDADDSPLSRQVVSAIQADRALAVRAMSAASGVDAVRRGKVAVAIELPAGFGARAPAALFGGASKPVLEMRHDPSQTATLAIVRGLVTQHAMTVVSARVFAPGQASETMADLGRSTEAAGALDPARKADLAAMFSSVEKVQRGSVAASAASSASGSGSAGGLALPFDIRAIETTAGEARPYNGYAHSFAGMGVQFILFMGIDLGIGLLLARRLGLWKRLRAAPLSRAALLASHLAGGTLISLVLLAILYAAAIIGFGVRIDGSVAGFVGVAIAFSCFIASFGLLLAAIGKTPEATRGLAIFVTLLLGMLGGAWVPAFIFPGWLQTATLAVPTRWVVDGLDAMTWRGLGFEAAVAPIAVLLAFALVFGALGIWRLDWEEPRGSTG